MTMVVTRKNVLYDPQKGLKTDIYYPNDTSSQTKILIFWHGGGWFRGSKDSVRDVGIDLANAGFMTFVPDYSLAPVSHFPAAHDDAVHFVQWLLESEYTDEDDQQHIAQIGSSVGGTMALKLAGLYGFPTITWSAPLDYSSWMAKHPDVTPSFHAKEELGLTKPQAINDAFYKYFALTYAGTQDPAVLEKMDAASYDYDALGKLLMFNSVAELTSLDSVYEFSEFLAGAGHQVNLAILPGHGHAMDYGRDYLKESIIYLSRAIDL